MAISARIENKDGSFVVLALKDGIWQEVARFDSYAEAVAWIRANNYLLIDSEPTENLTGPSWMA